MSRAKRVDENQTAIVRALRDVGATVLHTHAIGQGCPDILVGWRGLNYFLEIKDGNKPPSARRLTSDEHDWQIQWRGQVATVTNVDEALKAIGALP